jgi:hypothetical protein
LPDIEPWRLVDELVVAADRPVESVAETLSHHRPEDVVAVLLAEANSRLEPGGAAGTAVLAVEIDCAGVSLPATAGFRRGRFRLWPGTAERPAARLDLAAADLVRSLYGWDDDLPPHRWISLTPAPDRLEREELFAARGREAHTTAALHAVLQAFTGRCEPLSALAVAHGTDKWGTNDYTRHYERHFAALARKPVRVLEIGIGGWDVAKAGGASLRMWQRYFRRGLVCGLDLHDKPKVVGPRLRALRADQSDRAALRRIGDALGPFDIIIDDGSHINEHVQVSFETLLPYVRDGGYYVIEDVNTSYWPGFGGVAGRTRSGSTTMGLVVELLDGLHHREADTDPSAPPHRPSYPDEHVAGVHVYHNLVFVEKRPNTEQGAPDWLPKRPIV